MDRFAELTGRRYRLFDYVGAPDAERVVVDHGLRRRSRRARPSRRSSPAARRSACVKVRLYRPFDGAALVAALPDDRAGASPSSTARKEPGAVGEPLYQDVVTALIEAASRACPAPA